MDSRAGHLPAEDAREGVDLRLLASELEARVVERTREVEAERARLAAVVEQIPAGLTILGRRAGRDGKCSGAAPAWRRRRECNRRDPCS